MGVTAVIVKETHDIGVKEHRGPREVTEVLKHQLPQTVDHTTIGTPDHMCKGDAGPHTLASPVEPLQDQPTEAERSVHHQILPPNDMLKS